MARLLYGGTGADLIVTQADADAEVEFTSGVTFTAWTTRTGSTQLTDLQTAAGVALSGGIITPGTAAGDEGRIMFLAPDGYTGPIWLRNEAHTSYTRWLVAPIEDMTTRAGTTDHGALTGLGDDDHTQYFNTTRGDARYAQIGSALAPTIVDAKGDLIVGTADNTIARKANGTDGQFLRARPAAAGVAAVAWETVDFSVYATKAGGTTQLADWSATAPASGQVPVYTAGDWTPTTIDSLYAAAETGTGRLAEAAWPKYELPGIIINEGDPLPLDFPVGGIVFSRPAAATLIPTLLNANHTTTAGTVVTLTTPVAIPVGTYIGYAVGTSENTGITSTFTVGYSGGAAAVTNVAAAFQTGVSQANTMWAKVTTQIPASATITITCSQSRVLLMAAMWTMPNLASTSVLDQSTSNQGASNSTLDKVIGPTSAISQANELGIMAVCHNDGTGVITRPIGGTNSWNVLTAEEADVTTNSRTLTVLYKVYSAVAPLQGNFHITASDAASGGWAGVVASYKAA